MPPKGDRPGSSSSSSKDRDRQGAGNAGSGSKGVSASASAKGNAGASKSAAPAKASAPAKAAGGGGSSGTKSVATPAGMRSVSSTSSAASVKASPAAMSVANAPRAAAPAMSPARAAAQPIGPGGPSLSQSAVDPKSFNAASAAARAATPVSVAPVSAPVSVAPATSIRPEARPEERSGFLGGFTSLADMFDGGGPGQSGTTFEGRLSGVANALGFKPSTGRAGDGPAQAPRSMDRDGPDRGIASLIPGSPAAVAPVDPAAAAAPPVNLAQIGAPTNPMAPVFVDSPIYGMPGAVPMGMNYGSAFMGGPQVSPMDLMDIFAAYPNLGMR